MVSHSPYHTTTLKTTAVLIKSCLANQNHDSGLHVRELGPTPFTKVSVFQSIHFQRRFPKPAFSVEVIPPSHLLRVDGRLKRIEIVCVFVGKLVSVNGALVIFMRSLVRFRNVRQLAFIDSCNPLTPSVRHKGHLRTKNQSEKKGKTRREQRTKEKKFGHSRVKDFSMLSS